MKKLILPLVILTAAPALAAIDCATIPSCSSLGYSETAGACKGKYLTCPFDNTKIACLDSPKVGDLKYSLYSSNHDGWIKCDGTQYSTSTYSKLYSVIGTKFCHKYTSRTDTSTANNCKSGYFAVPDYRGFFLRGYKSSNSSAVDYHSGWPTVSNALYYKGNYLRYGGSSGGVDDSLYIPEYERLPNIEGYFYTGRSEAVTLNSWMGAFSKTAQSGYWANREASQDGGRYQFNASKSNQIYDGGHVVPANYATYIFIYAGQ